jgi:hypothetical protein
LGAITVPTVVYKPSPEFLAHLGRLQASDPYHERLRPLFHRFLGSTDPADRRAWLAAAERNLRLFRGLEEVLERTARAGVAVALLKGAALAEWVYGDPGVRPMSDVDLLVAEAHLPVLQEVLGSLGFERDPLWHPGLAEADNAIHFGRAADGLNLDLHLRPAYAALFPFRVPDMLARAVERPFGRARALQLRWEDHWLHGAYHLMWHTAWDPRHPDQRALLDLRALAEHGLATGAFDPACLAAWAGEHGLATVLWHTLALFDPPLPWGPGLPGLPPPGPLTRLLLGAAVTRGDLLGERLLRKVVSWLCVDPSRRLGLLGWGLRREWWGKRPWEP